MAVAAELRSTEQFCAALFRKAPFEFRLLAACCRWPQESAEAAISELIADRLIDWAYLLELGERHRVAGFLASALRRHALVPAEISSALAERAGRMERENLLHIAVAASVIRTLQREQISVVIMKGAPLSHVVYGNIAVRHSKDIDLLVDGSRAAWVEDILLANGFKAASALGRDLTQRQARSWERYRKHHDFVHTATGCQLELHWKPFDNAHLGSVSVREAEWVECRPGMLLPALSREELFPLLCAHGAGHAWFRLKWLADVAALLAQSTPQEQLDLIRSARERGLARPAEQALLLCAGLFEDPRIPTPAKSTLAGRWLTRVARDALLQPIKATSRDAEFVPRRLTASRLLLRREWRYRFEEARVNAASPVDWKTLPLPEWLHFVYPLVRVPLWLRRRIFSKQRRSS